MTRPAVGLERRSTVADVDPFVDIDWERRDARIENWTDGSIAFEQTDVEFPITWSQNATNIVAQKYFRGQLGTPARETSLRQVIDRVAGTITTWGDDAGYFDDDGERDAFAAELRHLLVHQKMAFNSPVWFNIGVEGVPQQSSACFILSVDDDMDDILEWYVEEGKIFKGGSGSGVNLSRIRASTETLAGGREPCQVQRRSAARPDEHVAVARQPSDEVGHDGRIGQAMGVVDDHTHLAGRHRNDRLDDPIDLSRLVRSAECQEGPGQEPLGIVGLGRAQPHIHAIGLIGQTLGQQSGLAHATAADHQGQRDLEPLLEDVAQSRSSDGLVGRSRRLIDTHHPRTARHRVPRSCRTPRQRVLQAQQLSAAGSISGSSDGSEISTAVVRPTPVTSGSGFSIEAKNVPVVPAGIRVR